MRMTLQTPYRQPAGRLGLAALVVLVAVVSCGATTLFWRSHGIRDNSPAEAMAMLRAAGASDHTRLQALVVLQSELVAIVRAIESAKLPPALEPHRANALSVLK